MLCHASVFFSRLHLLPSFSCIMSYSCRSIFDVDCCLYLRELAAPNTHSKFHYYDDRFDLLLECTFDLSDSMPFKLCPQERFPIISIIFPPFYFRACLNDQDIFMISSFSSDKLYAKKNNEKEIKSVVRWASRERN